MGLRSPPPRLIFFFMLFAISAVRSENIDNHASESRKLDESLSQSKCGGCPCGNPCPTTPTYPPPPPPPPQQKKSQPSTGSYCPPPPSPPSNFIYITGPPGSLYPVDHSYNNGVTGARSFAVAIWAAVGGGVVALFSLLFLFHQF